MTTTMPASAPAPVIARVEAASLELEEPPDVPELPDVPLVAEPEGLLADELLVPLVPLLPPELEVPPVTENGPMGWPA
jgi:hypothetical protein